MTLATVEFSFVSMANTTHSGKSLYINYAVYAWIETQILLWNINLHSVQLFIVIIVLNKTIAATDCNQSFFVW